MMSQASRKKSPIPYPDLFHTAAWWTSETISVRSLRVRVSTGHAAGADVEDLYTPSLIAFWINLQTRLLQKAYPPVKNVPISLANSTLLWTYSCKHLQVTQGIKAQWKETEMYLVIIFKLKRKRLKVCNNVTNCVNSVMWADTFETVGGVGLHNCQTPSINCFLLN